MSVRVRKASRCYGDSASRARKTLKDLFLEFQVETLAALKQIPSLPRPALDEALAAAHVLKVPNPTLSSLTPTPVPDFQGPLILPAPPKDPVHRQVKRTTKYTIPISSRATKTWARETLIRMYREFKVDSLRELLEKKWLPVDVREVALAARKRLQQENPTIDELKRALEDPKVAFLPSPKQRPDIPTSMRG